MTRLPVRMKMAYGATDFGFSMAGTVIMISLLYYAVNVLKLRPLLAGAILMAGKVWDALIDPAIGHLSDRVRTRWGRRRPFFLWFTLPYAGTFMLIWMLPAIREQWLLAVLFGLLNILFITFYSLLMVPYNTLGPEMTLDYDERTSLTSYRMAFSIVGGLVAAGALPMIVASCATERAGYAVMGLTFGLVLAVFPFFSFFGTREMAYIPGTTPSIRSGIKAAAANEPFLRAMAAFLVAWLVLDIISAVFLFYVQFCLGAGNVDLLLLTIFGTATVCLPVWIRISKAIGKKAAYAVGLGELALVLAVLAFFAPDRLWVTYSLAALAGIGVSAAHVMPYSIVPDAIDYDELRSGENHEGVYFGILTFLQQLASAGGVFLVSLFLEAFGFDQNLAVQTDLAQLGIRMALGLLPGLLIIIGLLVLARYPITRDEHRRIVAALAERRRTYGS